MALRHIRLRDFVIVKELNLDLSDGFTALTGETGAGKSILIDALQLAMGARGDASVVREGAERTEIAAIFDCNAAARAWLGEAGFDLGDDIVLRRVVDGAGKSRAWINGGSATMAQLRSLGDLLVDIHGQHAWQSLTRSQSTRDVLDTYAQAHPAHAPDIGALWRRLKTAEQALADALAQEASMGREREQLSWQIQELEKLSPQADEWTELVSAHTRQSHAQGLLEAAQSSLDHLDHEASKSSVTHSLNRVLSALQAQSAHEPLFQEWIEQIHSALANVEDVARGLSSYLHKSDLDPAQLAALDERMGLWLSLARRFKCPPEGLAALLADAKTRLKALDALQIEPLQLAVAQAQKAYAERAKDLTVVRKAAARELDTAVTGWMQKLGMQGGQFVVSVEPCESGPLGHDEVVFLVAGHAGSSPKPVGKVASGGELSRLALAIAVTTSAKGSTDTLIFDEVDSGIGGAVAETVGRLMQQLGRQRQVLAVTHLAQVAAYAGHHLLVRKHSEAGATQSAIEEVEGPARELEIARMLGGERILESTRQLAHDLLTQAKVLP